LLLTIRGLWYNNNKRLNAKYLNVLLELCTPWECTRQLWRCRKQMVCKSSNCFELQWPCHK